jgi:hypothetical protein
MHPGSNEWRLALKRISFDTAPQHDIPAFTGSSPAFFHTIRNHGLSQRGLSGLESRICAVDPGTGTFATIYDPRRSISCKFAYNCKRATRDLHPPHAKQMIEALQDDVINWLSENYDAVILPHFKLEDAIYGHRRFRQELSKRVNVLETDERSTTLACSWCGTLSPKVLKHLKCGTCGSKTDRDINAAKNIWMRWYMERPTPQLVRGMHMRNIKNILMGTVNDCSGETSVSKAVTTR